MDYKLSCSGMEQSMNLGNFDILNSNDTVKFVVGKPRGSYKDKTDYRKI